MKEVMTHFHNRQRRLVKLSHGPHGHLHRAMYALVGFQFGYMRNKEGK